MTLKEIADIIDAEIIVGDDLVDENVVAGCGCDLMSDVLSFIKSDTLLLTGLTNAQVVRTAEMADIPAICFVRDKSPMDETIKLASEIGITLLKSNLPLFEACGRLYQKGLKGCSEF